MRGLAAETDAHSATKLVDCLRRLGFEANSVATGGEVLHEFGQADIVLLDLELPDIDGLEVCRAIRATGETPVIVFAAGGNEAERVLGLQAGADDCIDKPYGIREVTARIEAVMRRARRGSRPARTIERGEMSIDPDIRQVRVGARPLPLTRKEFDLIHLLASEPDRVFSREELMTRIWQDSGATSRRGTRASRTLDTHVGTLRNKIGSDDWIVTVRGVGFRFGVRGAPLAA